MISSKITFTTSATLAAAFAAIMSEDTGSKVLQVEVEAILKQQAEKFISELADPDNADLRTFYENAITLSVHMRQSPADLERGDNINEIQYVLVNDDNVEFVLANRDAFNTRDELDATCVFDIPFTVAQVENYTSGEKSSTGAIIPGTFDDAVKVVSAYQSGEKDLIAHDLKCPSRKDDHTVAQGRMNAHNHVMLNRHMGQKSDVTIGNTVLLNSRNYASIADTNHHPFSN